MIELIPRVTGCKLRENTLTGDSGEMRGSLDCPRQSTGLTWGPGKPRSRQRNGGLPCPTDRPDPRPARGPHPRTAEPLFRQGPRLLRPARHARDGTRLLISSDRISAFDRILAAIPWKGQVLTQTARYWFDRPPISPQPCPVLPRSQRGAGPPAEHPAGRNRGARLSGGHHLDLDPDAVQGRGGARCMATACPTGLRDNQACRRRSSPPPPRPLTVAMTNR
jgi:hypothetical protein